MIKGPLPKTEELDFNSYLAGLQVVRPALTEDYLKPIFEKADTVAPIGSLNFEEFKVANDADKAALKLVEDMKDPVFAAYYAMDTDKDNKVTFDEFKAAALITKPDANEVTLKEEFDASDDGDGTLTLDEYKVMVKKVADKAILDKRIAEDPIFA